MINIDIITKKQQQTSTWSGGTTTQLAIFPKDSSYADRSFLWRLSTAVVELEESSFTKLPGFDRWLMVLEGELKLIYKEQADILLKQYDKTCFKGCWDTVSLGRARDFNLMLKEGVKGCLEHHKVAASQRLKIEQEAAPDKQCFFACYSYKGQISIGLSEKRYVLSEGDLLIINYSNCISIIAENSGSSACDLITAFIEV